MELIKSLSEHNKKWPETSTVIKSRPPGKLQFSE